MFGGSLLSLPRRNNQVDSPWHPQSHLVVEEEPSCGFKCLSCSPASSGSLPSLPSPASAAATLSSKNAPASQSKFRFELCASTSQTGKASLVVLTETHTSGQSDLVPVCVYPLSLSQTALMPPTPAHCHVGNQPGYSVS